MYKTHRVNHDFQIAYFLAGKCHTPDGAYALLHDLRDDRAAAIANYHVQGKRNAAKRLRIEANCPSASRADLLDRDADLEELDNGERIGKVLYEAAVSELKFIDKAIAAIKPLRRFAHLPDPEAHEAAQQEEWLRELIERAENMLFCHGSISPDHFTTMRAHPQFQSDIMPAITGMLTAMKSGAALQMLKAPGYIAELEKTLSLPKPGEQL